MKQLDFSQIQDPRPVPLIVADKWNFQLQYHVIDNVCYFSVIDWIVGIGSSDNFRAADTWRKLQATLRISNPSNIPANFATDIQLYDIAQNMRATKERPALKEIQDYLSQAGSLLDAWRRDPKQMLSAAMSRMSKDIERYEKAGYGHTPELMRLKAEYNVKTSLKNMNDMIKKVVDSPKYGVLHNAKLEALFGLKSKQIQELLNSKNIHDDLPTMQLEHIDFAQKQIVNILHLQSNGTITNERAIAGIEMAVKPLGDYLRDLCNQLGIDHVTGRPLLGNGKDKQ